MYPITIAAAFRQTVADHPDVVAFSTVDGDLRLTWSALRERVDAFAGGLWELGVRPGDAVAAMFTNRPEFNIADLAVVSLGGTGFSLYPSLAPEQIAHQLNNSAARVVVCERAFLAQLLAARELAPAVEHLIVLEGGGPAGTLAWADVEATASVVDVAALAAAVAPEDTVTLIYTSGTTGPPKGVELTHFNITEACKAVNRGMGLGVGDPVLSWLPNAHIAERIAHHYLPIINAQTVTTCSDIAQLGDALRACRPRWFFSVPRLWEKLKAGVEAQLATLPAAERAAAEAAIAAGVRRVRLEQAGEPVPAEVAAADATLFARLRAGLGLDGAAFAHAGGAPSSIDVLEFFNAIGVPLAELWGMSETCGAGTMGMPARNRIGTVGPASEGVELRLDTDGELLIRGPMVTAGYRNQPDETAEAFAADGWFRTGDIATIDADGFVKIVDRKKELIINAGGKNMSPANIEAALKSAGPLIGQACVIGDLRPYNVALLVLDPDTAPAWAADAGIGVTDAATLATSPAVASALEAEVEQANSRLSRVEQIKRFHLVTEDWLPGGDELTPTMKLKRKPIAEKYHLAIAALYERPRT
ncbi:MAG: long-chain acyl-CoA synthetase [Solirubrobacteraceae bacterium]|jgi:long-subunit acyl-CoA synthetase (AMP-forming)|nr:long-chain acyl-CoA synthetase [Solirubrobacteraceae bacterium]